MIISRELSLKVNKGMWGSIEHYSINEDVTIQKYWEGSKKMKIKDLIKKLEELDGEKTIGIYDYEECKEELSLLVLRNNYINAKCDYLIE